MAKAKAARVLSAHATIAIDTYAAIVELELRNIRAPYEGSVPGRFQSAVCRSKAWAPDWGVITPYEVSE